MFNHRMLLSVCSVEPLARQMYPQVETQQDVCVFVLRGTSGNAHVALCVVLRVGTR